MGKLVNNNSDPFVLSENLAKTETKVIGMEEALNKAQAQLDDLANLSKKDEQLRRIAELEQQLQERDELIARQDDMINRQTDYIRDNLIMNPSNKPVDEKPPISEEEEKAKRIAAEIEAEKQRKNQELEDFYNKFYNK